MQMQTKVITLTLAREPAAFGTCREITGAGAPADRQTSHRSTIIGLLLLFIIGEIETSQFGHHQIREDLFHTCMYCSCR